MIGSISPYFYFLCFMCDPAKNICRSFILGKVHFIVKRHELELELIQSHMAQKPVLRGEVGCACVVCITKATSNVKRSNKFYKYMKLHRGKCFSPPQWGI